MERGNLNVVQEEFNSSLAAAASSASDWGDACSLFKNFSSKAKWEFLHKSSRKWKQFIIWYHSTNITKFYKYRILG